MARVVCWECVDDKVWICFKYKLLLAHMLKKSYMYGLRYNKRVSRRVICARVMIAHMYVRTLALCCGSARRLLDRCCRFIRAPKVIAIASGKVLHTAKQIFTI